MAQPTSYARSFDFTQFATDFPSAPPPGVRLDAEYDAIGLTLGQTLANLALIQRDDGQLANQSVRLATLHSEVIAALTLGGARVSAWLTGTAYVVGEIVTSGDAVYLVATSHTSSVLAADIAANRLIRIFDSGISSGLIDAREFGVTADGVTDDTDHCIDARIYAQAHGGILQFPPGRIRVGDELFDDGYAPQLTDPCFLIRGVGMSSTIFVNQCTGKTPFNMGNTFFAGLFDFGIEGNNLTGASGNSHAISLIDPTFNVDDFRPQYVKLSRLWIYQNRGNGVDYLGASMSNGACGIYGANALNLVVEQCVMVDNAIGEFLYKCFLPKTRESTFYSNDYSGYIEQECEVPSACDCDFVTNDTLSGGSITLHDSITMRAASYVTYNSKGSSLRGSKLKSHQYTAISARNAYFPSFEDNWVTNDAVEGAVGLYAVSGIRANRNTFDRFGPFAGNRRDIHMVMGGGLNDIGEISTNLFRNGGGGTTTDLIYIDGSGAAALRGTIANNTFGDEAAVSNAVTVVDALRIDGTAGNLQIYGNRVHAVTSVTFTNAFNFNSTEGPGLRFTDNPITTDGGTVTNQIVGLSGVFARAGNSVDTAGFRQRLPSLYASKTFDWPDLATATTQSTTVTCTDAAVGDMVLVSMSVALSGTRIWGEVTAADTVTVYQRNDTGGNINLASGTLGVRVFKPF